MAIKKVKLPDNTIQDINDARISGVDTSPVSESDNVITSGGVYNAIENIESFYFVVGSSSYAGNGSSGSYLSTKWEGTIPGVTELEDGLKIAYRIKTNTGVSTAGAVLSIDGGTTYKPVVYNVNSVISNRYSVGSTILLTYNSTQTAVAYLTSNTKTTVTGCWQIMDYDANSYAYVRQYQSGDNAAGTSPKYPLLARYNLTNKNGSYDTAYSRYHTDATLDITTGALEASSFVKSGGTSSQFLKADGSVDSNDYALSSSIPSEVTESTVAGWGFTKNTGTYSKPQGGIPSTDLSSDVQISLGKADTALQSYTETDPTVPGWAKAVNKPTYTAAEVGALPDTTVIPTESTVAGWGFTKNTGTYSKPSGGIPKTDLESEVQTSLGKADTALQSYTETDPVFTASAAHGISSTDISNWNAKQKAITVSSSEPTSSQGSNGDIWIVI